MKYLEVVIIGSNKYLVVGDVDYFDDLSDEVIANANKRIINDLKLKVANITQVFLTVSYTHLRANETDS